MAKTEIRIIRLVVLLNITVTLLFFLWLTNCDAGYAVLAQHQDRQINLENDLSVIIPPISPAVTRLLDSSYLTETERSELRLFHGIWLDDGTDTSTTQHKAQAATLIYNFDDEIFTGKSGEISPELVAEVLSITGQYTQALQVLKDTDSVRADYLRAECHYWSGQFQQAESIILTILEKYNNNKITSAQDLTCVAQSLILQAKIIDVSGKSFEQVVSILGHVDQKVDRLYWPAKLVLADLLAEKDNQQQAKDTYLEILSLNPKCSEALYGLGQLGLNSFDFELVEEIFGELTRINKEHPLALILAAQMDLYQGLPDECERKLKQVLSNWPLYRPALALYAACNALWYDEDGMYNALDDFDQLSPNHAYAYYIAGVQLARDRQYQLAADILEQAIKRQPNWAAPLVELGLMEMQYGRDDRALNILTQASRVDPYDRRVKFSLHLLDLLSKYGSFTSEHFIVKYDPETIDIVMAKEMPELLEKMHTEVARAFDYVPDRKTTIELMPTHERFAVRITGMPRIHTIAASTGPVIAMESPRAGSDNSGAYDWLRVIRHEYTHTITLGRTHNRIPHWFTEAAAVWQELAPWDYNSSLTMAYAYKNNELFDLDEINWAFIRPQKPGDRSKAYDQGRWMFEYLIEKFGRNAMLHILDQYRQGYTEDLAIPDALGVSRFEFYDGFVKWAGTQVQKWGLDSQPSFKDIMANEINYNDPQLHKALAQNPKQLSEMMAFYIMQLMTRPISEIDRKKIKEKGIYSLLPDRMNITPDMIPEHQWDRLLSKYPAHADLLYFKIQTMLQRLGDAEDLIPWLEKYLAARPVDPLSHRILARIYLHSSTPQKAIGHLEELDRLEQNSTAYAIELARQYRAQKKYQLALAKSERALTIDPFNPAYRELAATIAIQANELTTARRHIEALTLIEPDQEIHYKRLQALDRMLNKQDN